MKLFENIPPYPRVLLQHGLALGGIYIAYIYLLSLTPIGNLPYIGLTQLLLTVGSIIVLIRLLRKTKQLEKNILTRLLAVRCFLRLQAF